MPIIMILATTITNIFACSEPELAKIVLLNAIDNNKVVDIFFFMYRRFMVNV